MGGMGAMGGMSGMGNIGCYGCYGWYVWYDWNVVRTRPVNSHRWRFVLEGSEREARGRGRGSERAHQAGELAQVAVRVGVLCAKDRADLVDPVQPAARGSHLLVQLRGLPVQNGRGRRVCLDVSRRRAARLVNPYHAPAPGREGGRGLVCLDVRRRRTARLVNPCHAPAPGRE